MKHRLLYILALSLAVLLAGFVWRYRSALYVTLDEFKLIPAEERLTELFLNTDSFSLPDEIAPARHALFSFTIHNLEGHDIEYPYRVRIQYDNNASSTIKSDVVAIQDKESRVITQSYIFTAPAKKAVIFIELPDQGQLIHFAVPSAY